MTKYFTILLLSLFLAGCSAEKLVHYEVPPDWRTEQARKESISKYSKFLNGKKIFIDPGHGGEDRRSWGKNKLVCEADLNVKVGLALKNYLTEAGATVYMSREKDQTVALKERSHLANASDADIFISIHHNAPGKSDGDWINYTSTYYHALESDYEYEPCQRDIARYVQRDLAFVMGNSGGLGSFDGTYSDYIIYPKAGFSVLRLTEKPAVLVECGFFSNEYEEMRLALDEFNQIQAWGIFRGIGKYFQAGIPEIVPFEEKQEITLTGNDALNFRLKDASGINPKSIQAYMDSVTVSHSYDRSSGILTIPIMNALPGGHTIRIICANNNGNHAFPFKRKLQFTQVQSTSRQF